LEELTGAELALHVTTGGADINPRVCLLPDGQGARTMGLALAEAVAAALGGARPLGLSPLRSAAVPMELKVRPVLDRGPRDLLAGRVRPGEAPCVASEVQAIRLGELALVSAPGELFAQLVTCVENLSPFAHTIVVGHANDALGYLYTDTAGREGGYEVIHGACSDSTERPFLAAAHSALDLCGPAQG
jgi:hypothetical protein